MTDKERKELVDIIKKEMVKLQRKIEELKEFTQPVEPDSAIGRISRMDAINNKSIYDASIQNSRNRLAQLENILKMKNDDSFGVCIKCHNDIPTERLKIRPEIRLCAGCLEHARR
ncbi:MAG: TraR/DksA C4-type zinc finger protein [Bacteroidales bacterium]|nr:TraR/DksA C4-type zinc finger protein [Bacteroidales bacterium]